MTCKEIYDVIIKHTDDGISVFICARDWANTNDGVLIAENLDEDIFYARFGDKVPTDWTLCCNSDDDCINLGFLF